MVASFLGKIRSKVLNSTFNRVGRPTTVQSENLSKNHITKGALLKLEDKEYALLKLKHFLFFVFSFLFVRSEDLLFHRIQLKLIITCNP